MQELVIVFGPMAVGKMTVGQEVADITGFKLFHAHHSIEVAAALFAFGTPSFARLNSRIRAEVFDAVAESDLPGLIYTFAWAFNLTSDKDYIDRLVAKFEARGARASFVELEARLDVRIDRNKQPSRLVAKPSKRDVPKSEALMLHHCEKFRLNTTDEEPFYYPERYIKLETSDVPAAEAAKRVCDHFGFPRV